MLLFSFGTNPESAKRGRSNLKNLNSRLARFFRNHRITVAFHTLVATFFVLPFQGISREIISTRKEREREKSWKGKEEDDDDERANEGDLKKEAERAPKKSGRREAKRKPRKRKKDAAPSLAIGHPFRSTWNRDLRSTEKFNKAHAPY